PLPLLSSTLTVPLTFAATMSRRPLPRKSPTATEVKLPPTWRLIGFSRVPSPLPSSTLTVPLAFAVTTSSGAVLPSKCPVATACGAPGRLNATGAAKLSTVRSSSISRPRTAARNGFGEDRRGTRDDRDGALIKRCNQFGDIWELLL